MCRIKSISLLDVGFSKCSAVVLVTISLLILTLSLAVTITTRVFLECYYVTGHMALVACFVSGFLLSHHIGRFHEALGISYQVNGIIQSVLNLLYWQGVLLIAISYTGLLVLEEDGQTNWDHFGAAAWMYISLFMMTYLLVISVSIALDRDAAYSVDHLGYGDKLSHNQTSMNHSGFYFILTFEMFSV